MAVQENNNKELTYGELYVEFCNCNPEIGAATIDYRPWGNNSIVIWLDNGKAYKVKRHSIGRFTMQSVSNDDIRKKFGLNN